jgi:hypothetical protein
MLIMLVCSVVYVTCMAVFDSEGVSLFVLSPPGAFQTIPGSLLYHKLDSFD